MSGELGHNWCAFRKFFKKTYLNEEKYELRF